MHHCLPCPDPFLGPFFEKFRPVLVRQMNRSAAAAGTSPGILKANADRALRL